MGFSTQLLNDRLLIDGLFGVNSMNQSSAAQKASTIVGDINIQYTLTENRRWRAKMFNRTNVIGVLDNNSQYTQGIGISYQRDFEHWGDLLKREKKKEKEKTKK
jgi:translocation and assembly module TamB